MENNKGQMTLEFILAFVFGLGILFMFINMTINAGAGYLAHYATFMASRAYLVFENVSLNDTEVGTDLIVNKALDDFGMKVVNLDDDEREVTINSPGTSLYEYSGVVVKFKKKFAPFAFMGGTEDVNFISESFLGREPTRGECFKRICDHVMGDHIGFQCESSGVNPSEYHITVYDNGC